MTSGSDLRPQTLKPQGKLIGSMLLTPPVALKPGGTLPSSRPWAFTCRKLGTKSTSGIAEVSPSKMAAPLELTCWGGGWGLPSVHSESLVVMVRTPAGQGVGQRGGARGARLVEPGLRGLQRFPAAVPRGASGPRLAGTLRAASP